MYVYLLQKYIIETLSSGKIMFRQIFSTKQTSLRLLILCICSAMPLVANPITIGQEGYQGKSKYIGKSLEILSERSIFENLEQLEELPIDFQKVLLSGKMGSDPNILVNIHREQIGVYSITLRDKNSDEESIINWGIEDVLKEENFTKFKPSSDEIPVLDFTGHAYWFRLPLHNILEKPIEIVIELDKNTFSWFDLIHFRNGSYVSMNGSYEDPMSLRVIQDSKILFPLELLPGEQDIYLRMDSQLIDTVPIRLWTADEYYRQNNKENFLHGLTSGASLLLFVYALFLAYSLKERGYLYLAFLILTGYLVHISESGLAMNFFWPEKPMGSVVLFSIAFPLTIIVNLIFCRYYLQIHKRTPFTDKIIKIILFTSGLLLIFQFFVPLNTRFIFTGIAVVLDYLSVIPLLIAAIVSFRKEVRGNRSSLYMLIAISFQLLSYLEFWLSRFNFIPLGMIDFLHIRSIGFVLVMLGGVRFKMRLLEKTVHSLRKKLEEIIAGKSLESHQKVLTDKTLIKVEAVKDLIEKNYTEPLYRNDLAVSVDLSGDHLGRMFKRLTGEKISDYINRLRIEEACRRLNKNQYKIIDIAFDVGFENLRTFNLCFSKITGMSPSDYRKNYKE